MKKKDGSSVIGYTCLFALAVIIVMVSLYMIQVAKLMTEQHTVDDALTDAALGTLVADDNYYFSTSERFGTPIVRFKSTDESHTTFVSCMNASRNNENAFFHNFRYKRFILYEVEGSRVKITEYFDESNRKSVSYGNLGSVTTPAGKEVKETSVYSCVGFDIKSVLNNRFISKTRDIYCTLEVN